MRNPTKRAMRWEDLPIVRLKIVSFVTQGPRAFPDLQRKSDIAGMCSLSGHAAPPQLADSKGS
jgi:hypothetical protein